MASVIKVNNIQNTESVDAITIDNSGFVIPKAVVFSVYKSSAQTLTGGTWTKITFDTEEYDTANSYDTVNSKFIPTIAGYYQLNISLAFLSGGGTAVLGRVHKNGSHYKNAQYHYQTTAELDDIQHWASMMIHMNGSSDYVEIYGAGVGLVQVDAGSTYTTFQGHLIGA